MSTPTCLRCGSDRIRRARARTGWQQLLRAVTPLRRYACLACGHRGWTSARLSHRSHADQAPPPAPQSSLARPLESRDHRARWRRRMRVIATIVAALVLGAVAANRLVSCQSQPTQAPE
jgi:hypothetical protein